MGKPGGLPSMGLHRVGHDRSDLAAAAISFREGNGTLLQYSCLENPMDRGGWKAAVNGVAEGQTQLSDFTFTFMHWRRKWQPTVFLPGESQGRGSLVGCHLLLQCMKAKSESEVAQSCPTLSDPMDCSLPGSSIHGVFQGRVLDWGAIALNY